MPVCSGAIELGALVSEHPTARDPGRTALDTEEDDGVANVKVGGMEADVER
jgi:hypothetical protein